MYRLAWLAAVVIAAAAVLASAAPAGAEPGLQSALTAISGQGTGYVEVSPTAAGQGTTFLAQGTANLHDALPNATFKVQRAVDFTPNDGVCTIAPTPPAGWITLTTLTTSEAGAGAAHFVRESPPPGPPGFRFDVIFRVMSDDGTQVFMSDCMTVTVK
jgi:predicted secreted Zn-dependent protease